MADGLDTNHVVYNYAADSTEATSTRVVYCVSAALDRDPLDLPPLYDAVDPDALDVLVSDAEHGRCHLSFQYAGADVHISNSGDIRVVLADAEG